MFRVLCAVEEIPTQRTSVPVVGARWELLSVAPYHVFLCEDDEHTFN